MKQILNRFLNLTGGEKFYRFGNSDGKFWVVPARGMRTAMSLYQPSGRKGKMVKSLLPYLHWIAFVRRAIHAETLHCRLNKEIHKLLCEIFNTNEIDFAIFEGTPSSSQKSTLQISCGKKILGYCKISDKENIYNLFKQEAEILNWLKSKGINGVPSVLYCDKFNDSYLFIQSTKKGNLSKITHSLTTKHIEFINQIHKKTVQYIPFEESDFYNDVLYLKSVLRNRQKSEVEIFERSIILIENYYSTRPCYEFSFSHGDFTPWNMYIENNNIEVFDFEFAAKTFPPRIDLIHYFLQTLILEKRLNAEEIYPRLELFKKRYNISTTITICYLVHILSFYSKLLKEKFSTNDNGYIVWSSLLKKQLNSNI